MDDKIVVGLGFGDEGKGAAVDWLCKRSSVHTVIRYNGGPQAAHNVVLPDGGHHTFAQFGSGTFQGARTHISQYCMFNPFNLLKEQAHLEELGFGDMIRLMTVSENALLITPYHVLANRTRETIRGANRHGSTGQGIGETMAYSIDFGSLAPRVGDLLNRGNLTHKIGKLYEHFQRELPMPNDTPAPHELLRMYAELVRDMEFTIVNDDYIQDVLDEWRCVFEGAQGVLLDQDYGFHPHTTWSDTTTRNAKAILGRRRSTTIGVTRSYHTRHGAGPFPTEGMYSFTEQHNGTGVYQGGWREGALDLSLLEYAVRANGGVDNIMVTHMDALQNGPIPSTFGYDIPGHWNPLHNEKLRLPTSQWEQIKLTEFLKESFRAPTPFREMRTKEDVKQAIEDTTGTPVLYVAYGPTHRDRYMYGMVSDADLLAVR